jgi:serine/threonine-protein kinase
VSGDPRIGTVVAGCRIEGRLRPGGMSVVYLAEHLHLGRKVAVKVLDQRLAEDEDYRKRFIRESRLAASLYHPNIVPIYDAGEADGLPYITMHFVEGVDLAELMEKESPIEAERLLPIVRQSVNALDAAHERGLVHRDVKPANILIASGSGAEPAGHVYLSDFGLAKQVESGTRLTKAGLFMGTLDYVAPEQIQGQGVDRRVDVYAMGCVVFECLTGEPPFRRDTEMAMMFAHIQEPPPRATERRADLPAEVDEVLIKAMAKRPDDRYESAGAFLDELEGALIQAVVPVATTAPVEERDTQPIPDTGEPAAPPEDRPAAPPLEWVMAMDYPGHRFGLGRTRDTYAIWDLRMGGAPVETFFLSPEGWSHAWRRFEELESTPTGELEEQPSSAAPAEGEAPSSGPLLVGVVFLDFRGTKFGLGRTASGYAIWDLRVGGGPVQAFSLDPGSWEQAWQTYQSWEAYEEPGAATTAEREAPGAADAGAGLLAGALAVDYRGAGYGLGRTAGGYAIWDLRTGGSPILTYPLTGEAWQQAWQAYQQLEQQATTSS